MRTLLVRELGSLDSLEVVEMDSAPLIDGHVRVAVTAAGVNFVDALLIEGKYQIKPPVPFRPGSEVVGTVVEVAADVSSPRPGDRVFAPVGVGGFSDEVVVHATRAVPLPRVMSDGQGATFMQSYMTAWFAFARRARVREGMTMLVLGAGGGIGLAAIDVGVSLGMRVVGAASSEEKRALATAAGAFATIDVLTEDVKSRARELCGGSVDIVYDPVGGDLAEQGLRALGPFGQHLVVGFVGGIPRLPANHILLTNRTVVGVDWGAWVGKSQRENAEMLGEVLAAIAAGRLNPVEPTVYPMRDAARAMRDLEERRVAGKIALVPEFD